MGDPIRLLRVAYRTGAILDGLTIVPMLSPRVGAAMFGLREFHPGPDYRYAMGLAASLMLGWTCLLLWADRRPLERRGVLVLTVVPVIAGLFASGVYAVASGMVELRFIVPMFVVQVLVCALFLAAYARSREAAPAS